MVIRQIDGNPVIGRRFEQGRRKIDEGGNILAEPKLPGAGETAPALASRLKTQHVVGDKPRAIGAEQGGESGLAHARATQKRERRSANLDRAGVQDTFAGQGEDAGDDVAHH